MLGMRADMAALEEMLRTDLPDLWDHCLDMHLRLDLWAVQWLLVHFINIVPATTALRVMEVRGQGKKP
jgi:hypothetical protein